MTREEEITKNAVKYEEHTYYSSHCKFEPDWSDVRVGFIEGAKWADEHPSQELKRQIVNKAVEWIKENITYTDNGTKKCLVNLGPFIDAIMEE